MRLSPRPFRLPALLTQVHILQVASVGVAWFGIFLELFLIIGVVHTLATDSIATHRLQISVFGSIAIVFAVIAVNDSIYSGRPSLDAMAAGWLILAIVDILWVIFFTSEEDSLAWHVLNSLGTGGLTPPSRRRRSAINLETANGGFPAGYSNVTTDKHSSQHAGMDRESGVQPPDGPPPAPMGPTPPPEPDVGVGPAPEHPSAPHKSAKALYACEHPLSSLVSPLIGALQTQPPQTTPTRSRSPRARSSRSPTATASGGRLQNGTEARGVSRPRSRPRAPRSPSSPQSLRQTISSSHDPLLPVPYTSRVLDMLSTSPTSANVTARLLLLYFI